MKTRKHQCRIQLAASKPVAYRLVNLAMCQRVRSVSLAASTAGPIMYSDEYCAAALSEVKLTSVLQTF